MGQFTGTINPNRDLCEASDCPGKARNSGAPYYATLFHFGRKLCWTCSARESSRIREEPEEHTDTRPFRISD
jgi:hypothetical protein